MSLIHYKLEELLRNVEKSRVRLKDIQRGKLNKLDELEDLFEGYIVVTDIRTMTPVYMNEIALKYIGYRKSAVPNIKSNEFFLKILHPTNLDLMTTGILFFNRTPKETFSSVARIKKYDGTWHFIFFSSRVVEWTDDGRAALVLVFALDVDEVLDSKYVTKDFKTLYKNNHQKSSLTNREIEIITLIAKENTTQTIAKILELSPHTVDTHRKNLIKKLKVKSSMGLAIYAFKNGLV